jgi:carboxyl-terminal processing protease
VQVKASRWLIVAVPICLSVLLTGTASGQTHDGRAAAGEPQPPCAAPTTPTPVTPTTIGTIEQACHCILDHYVDGSTLDHRVMLTGAFAAFTQELARRGLDQADATPPVLTGDRVRDWTAFGAVYQRVSTHLPTDPALRQALAAATLTGLVRSLHDNHLGWFYPLLPPGYLPGMAYGLGFNTAPFVGLAVDAPQEALPPLFVTTVIGGPAAQYGLLPGDVIEAVNGAPRSSTGRPARA